MLRCLPDPTWRSVASRRLAQCLADQLTELDDAHIAALVATLVEVTGLFFMSVYPARELQ